MDYRLYGISALKVQHTFLFRPPARDLFRARTTLAPDPCTRSAGRTRAADRDPSLDLDP